MTLCKYPLPISQAPQRWWDLSAQRNQSSSMSAPAELSLPVLPDASEAESMLLTPSSFFTCPHLLVTRSSMRSSRDSQALNYEVFPVYIHRNQDQEEITCKSWSVFNLKKQRTYSKWLHLFHSEGASGGCGIPVPPMPSATWAKKDLKHQLRRVWLAGKLSQCAASSVRL